ncbi:MAG: putative maltokinase, partial [Nitrobacter sp.]
SSLLNWTKKLISVRKSSSIFGRGTMAFVRSSNRSVLAYVRQHDDEVVLCVANLSRSAQASELDLSNWKGRSPLEMLGRTTFPDIGEPAYLITLAPYGFYWFQLTEKPPSPNVAPMIVPDYETLVVPFGATWMSLARTRLIFERDVLPSYLARSRWFPERSANAITARVPSAIPLTKDQISRPWLVIFDVTYREQSGRYAMPIRIRWDRLDRSNYDAKAIAAVRQGSREGTLIDAAHENDLITGIIDDLRHRAIFEEGELRLAYLPTERLSSIPEEPISNVRAVQTEQSNSTALVDEKFVVKIYRKLENGINPEVEVGRFLTDVAGFANTPALLGSVELTGPDTQAAIAIVHAFVGNQGDAWTVTSAALDRFVDEQRLVGASDSAPVLEEKAVYQRYMTQTGKRVAEMQVALASRDDIVDFHPEMVTPSDVARLIDRLMVRADQTFDRLAQAKLPESDRLLADEVLGIRTMLHGRLTELMPPSIQMYNIRHHGDFHLGQVLVVRDDVFIIDFEGEPRRSLPERRMKAPAARDVAGLIRSIDYSVTSAQERALKTGSDDDGRLADALSAWRDEATQTFLTAYREAMSDPRLWPQDDDAADKTLQFFLLEKAFYEIDYELAHRPDWLRVALGGALRVLRK